jgi:hypothetical protein
MKKYARQQRELTKKKHQIARFERWRRYHRERFEEEAKVGEQREQLFSRPRAILYSGSSNQTEGTA